MRNAMFFPNRILYREELLSTTENVTFWETHRFIFMNACRHVDRSSRRPVDMSTSRRSYKQTRHQVDVNTRRHSDKET